MSKYYIGVDMATDSDYTMYCISKAPNKLQRLINKLLGKNDPRKVIYCGDDERVMRKYAYKGAKIFEEYAVKDSHAE